MVEAATSIVLRQKDGDYPRRDRSVRRILRTIFAGQIVIIDLHPDFAFTVKDRGEIMLGTVGREFAMPESFEQLGLDECHMGFRRRSESFEAIAREQDARAAIEAKACIVVQARDRRGSRFCVVIGVHRRHQS